MNTAGQRSCRGIVGNALCVALCMALYAAVPMAQAQTTAATESVRQYDIPAGSLSTELSAWGAQSDRQLVFAPDLIAGKQGRGISGRYGAEQALTQLLAGTGLAWERVNGQTYTVKRAPPADANQKPTSFVPLGTDKRREENKSAKSRPVELTTVQVTGSRIRGAPPSSSVIHLSSDEIARAGQSDLGEVIRDIPQNFSGGQNPGDAGGGDINNQNLTGGSALNLRGLGADATLTLLNGKRLAYDGFGQGVDISQIPLAALDRIEIVADGASAIYGSDAVGGVANVILKPDYKGAAVGVRYGAATRGGDLQRHYDVTSGTTWASGGFLATVSLEADTNIDKSQRSYTSYMLEPSSLLPDNRVHSGLVTGHQELGSIATLKMDALYTHRNSDEMDNYVDTLYDIRRTTTQYTISPTLDFHLPATWSLSVNGLYARDKGILSQAVYSTDDGSLLQEARACYCNSIRGWEVDSEGPLFSLPGGDSRLAVGGGYRKNSFEQSTTRGDMKNYFAYAELYLPLVDPRMHTKMVNQLSLTGAIRRERYNRFGGVTTPKLGLVYAPSPDLDLKASWGKSFKTPTLTQQYSPSIGYLWPVSYIGGTGYSESATALMIYGGNPSLRPERSTNWTGTLSFHPRALPGLQVDLSYFHIDYTDRITQAIATFGAAMSDPAYRQFINFNPTPDEKKAIVDAGGDNFRNITGKPYDPADVVATVYDRAVNIGVQNIHGVDLSIRDQFDWGMNSLVLSADATWLYSRQRYEGSGTGINLAGTLFNPPHMRARLGASWQREAFSLSAYYNYIGGVTDTVQMPNIDGDSMRTLDLTGIYHFRDPSGLFSNVDLLVSIRNLTDERPPLYLVNDPTSVNYDSTNYSAIGRFVSFTIKKRWD